MTVSRGKYLDATVFQGLVWPGEPESAQAGAEVTQLLKGHNDPAAPSETSHHQCPARCAREREAATIWGRANGLNGGIRRQYCVFS